MTGFQVDPGLLQAEAVRTREVTEPVQAARTAVAEADAAVGAAGHELVADGLADYVAWWTQAIGGLAAAGEVIADQLTATADDYAAVDDRAAGALRSITLPGAPTTFSARLAARLGGTT
jgi:uncharacterized protein YukE